MSCHGRSGTAQAADPRGSEWRLWAAGAAGSSSDLRPLAVWQSGGSLVHLRGLAEIKPMRGVFTALCLILALSVSAKGMAMEAEVASAATEEASIRHVLDAFMDAWNKHDAEAFSMVFVEDADFTNVRGMGAHGRTEIAKFHAPMFATNFKDSHQKLVDARIRFIKPDVAAVDAWWEMTGAKTREGQEIPLRKGLLNFVMTKVDGHWLIAVMHNMDLPPPP